MHFRAPQPNSRANHRQSNEANEQQEEDGSQTSRALLSGSSSDILETGDRREEGVRILPYTVGVQDEPLPNRITFTIKSSTRMNRQQPLDLVRRPALGDKERKRKAEFNKENCTERELNRIHERSSTRLNLKYVEAQKC